MNSGFAQLHESLAHDERRQVSEIVVGTLPSSFGLQGKSVSINKGFDVVLIRGKVVIAYAKSTHSCSQSKMQCRRLD
jgi:hypothetical protein